MITEKVSIIMPAYNVGKYIADTIKSVLSQQYAYWELLIIDDGSTDNTREVVQTFKDGRIKMFTQPTQLRNFIKLNVTYSERIV